MTGKIGQVTDLASIQTEFGETVKSLEWPEGAALPSIDSVANFPVDKLKVGEGLKYASRMWECTWQKKWLAFRESNPKIAEMALKVLEKVPGMLYMNAENANDDVRSYFSSILEKAKAGDSSGFIQNIKWNFPNMLG